VLRLQLAIHFNDKASLLAQCPQLSCLSQLILAVWAVDLHFRIAKKAVCIPKLLTLFQRLGLSCFNPLLNFRLLSESTLGIITWFCAGLVL